MSIRDENKSHLARAKQQEQIDERHSAEAEARPGIEHRALIFILRQVALNNRDAKREADFYIAELDKEGADPEKLEQLETTPAQEPDAGDPPTSQTAPSNQPPAPDTAAALRTSRRFQKNKTD